MGLNFRIFTKAEHYTMSSAAAALRKVAAAAAASAAAAPASSAAPKTTSASSAAHPATCKHGDQCRGCKVCKKGGKGGGAQVAQLSSQVNDLKAELASMKAAAGSSPKPAVKGGDGGGSAQLAALEARLKGHIDLRFTTAEEIMSAKVDGLTKQVATGFNETKTLLTEQQQATLGMQQAMAALMQSTAAFQSGVSGLLTAGGAPRRELPAPPARLAICASDDSYAIKMAKSRQPESGPTGTHIDLIQAFLDEKGLPVDETLQTAVLGILGTTLLNDHTKAILSSIASSTKDDTLAALLFMLLTGSQQFRRSDLQSFRNSCASHLGASRASTQAIFSTVCQAMVSKNPKWEIKKKTGVIVANSLLKDSSQHPVAFDALVKNFQS